VRNAPVCGLLALMPLNSPWVLAAMLVIIVAIAVAVFRLFR
jgi:hypothetical protein